MGYLVGYFFGNNLVLIVIVLIACLLARFFITVSRVLIVVGMILNTFSFIGNCRSYSMWGFPTTYLSISYVIGLVIGVIGLIIVNLLNSYSMKSYARKIKKEIEEENKNIEVSIQEQISAMRNEAEVIGIRIRALYWLWDHITYPASDEIKANILKGLSNLNDDEGKAMNKSSLEKMLRYYCKEFSGFALSENSEEKEMLHKVMNDYFIK